MQYRVGVAGCLVALFLILSGSVAAQDSTQTERVVPEIKALRINPHPPVIDGNLDDPIWSKPGLELARNFTQRDPDEGVAPTESTVVAVTYDDDALYFAFWCYDSEPDKIQRQLVRRDRQSESDLVVVRLDPYHDHQTGNQFYVSAAGVLIDGRVYNDDWTDDSWDGVWEAAAKVHPWGWAVEYRIPYNCLRFTEDSEHVWGVNFARLVNRKSEVTWWSFAPQSENGLTSHYGHLTGLTGIRPARHLEILPYAVSSAEFGDGTDANPDGRDYLGNVGVDVKYGLASNLTLDATINPDFGQVELDQPVLNLSAFETWFPERRPFFIEGADLYETPFMLFYSRRIGRPPTGGVDDDLHDYTLDRPAATSILGAAKITGKLSGRTSVALLNTVTQEETETYMTTEGETRKTVVEPTANYSVFRVKQDILRNSYFGGLFTLVSQDTYHPAVTGGVDWRLYTNNGVWNFNGQTVFSRVDNEDIGFGVSANLEKASGKHVRGSIGVTNKDPNLHINRLGYTSRNDYRVMSGWLQYRTQDDWWIFRNTWNNFNIQSAWNYAGDDISRYGNVNSSWELTNFWSLGWGVEMQAEKYSDVETRGNGLWEWPVTPTCAGWADLHTDTRRKIVFDINPGGGRDRGGSWWANYVGIEYRPRSNLEFEVGANYHRTFNGTRWLDNDNNDNAVFADLDKDEISLHLTASVMLRRNLSWQLSGQGLISTLDYRDIKRYTGDNTYVRDINAEDYADYNGTFSSLNSMMIVRWEYLPGSTLYFVWTRSRPEFDSKTTNLALDDELDRFFSRGADNVWLLKASYWWNL
ncbi:MAG TPA: DUF5916 domain-containing protein [Acidobacteriota bacterium]|nr:DUF5916 domain-containing protein [Acidobacteriota bacterium]